MTLDSPVHFEAFPLEAYCAPHLRDTARQLMPLLYDDFKRLARSERGRHISPENSQHHSFGARRLSAAERADDV